MKFENSRISGFNILYIFCNSMIRWFGLNLNNKSQKFIPVTRRVKGNTRFVKKYVTGRRKRFTPYKIYIFIFLIRINSRVDLAMSVCLYVRMNVEISRTIKARRFRKICCFQRHRRSASTLLTLTPTNRPKLPHSHYRKMFWYFFNFFY